MQLSTFLGAAVALLSSSALASPAQTPEQAVVARQHATSATVVGFRVTRNTTDIKQVFL